MPPRPRLVSSFVWSDDATDMQWHISINHRHTYRTEPNSPAQTGRHGPMRPSTALYRGEEASRAAPHSDDNVRLVSGLRTGPVKSGAKDREELGNGNKPAPPAARVADGNRILRLRISASSSWTRANGSALVHFQAARQRRDAAIMVNAGALQRWRSLSMLWCATRER